MTQERVLLGVSGGIDSAVASFMLRRKGYRVIGLHLVMTDKEYISAEQHSAEISALLSIDVHIYDARNTFKNKILDPFIESYLSGETPSPCTWCNNHIKWKILKEMASEYGCTGWATGHYCSSTEHEGRLYIKKGIDPLKDQSYYLWALGQETLKGAIMPLGGYTKEQIKEIASSELGLESIAKKRESMGLCFLGGRGYGELIESHYSDGEGDIVDKNGNIVGQHKGYPFYTLAQKKGLEIPSGMCITSIDHRRNQLIIGEATELYQSSFRVKDWSVVSRDELLGSDNVEVKVRGIGRNPEGYCNISLTEDGDLVVATETPAWAIAAGQPVVFYIGDRVIGGGYATKS